MVYLDELMKRSELVDMLDRGYVRVGDSPDGTLQIFNYTNKSQFDNEWNDVTEQTRGLIIDAETEEVVSRPFRKFFNWEQMPPNMQAALMNEPVEVFPKWDGSLGILYGLHTGESAIATRGSFSSPQAKHATEVLRSEYASFEPIQGLTYLFEIVYPENRIVVDYGNMDDLVLLAVIDTETGRTLPNGAYDWPGCITEPFPYASLSKVLEAPQVANQEGFVVRFPSTDMRVKIKFAEYIRLHRILTGVSTLSIWDALANGTGVSVFIDRVPDEFYDWVRQQVARLEADYKRVHDRAVDEYEWILKRVRRPEVDVAKRRKEFALLANETDYASILFAMYDGRDYAPRIWKRIRPQFEKPYNAITEETA
jgi:RNA ligase